MAVRVGLSGVLGALLLAVLLIDDRMRGWEAVLASHVVAAVARTETAVNSVLAVMSFNEETGDAVGLRISPECTSGFLIVPLLGVTILILWLSRRTSVWPLVALAVAVVLLFATNQVRILALVVLIKGLGFDPGYYWGHTMVGSMISVFGIGAALVAYVLLTMRGVRR
ncbi:hypothetical protein [Herbidospora sp. NBRC 101105]|uniref:hypothetical protein n=1 Tax=Herbidospora sp. NBRC 101105 TaxID=3032195 RepID=UPI0025525FB2|nr:hypothetical protein [Herbidospora sp. NBRC 101105]